MKPQITGCDWREASSGLMMSCKIKFLGQISISTELQNSTSPSCGHRARISTGTACCPNRRFIVSLEGNGVACRHPYPVSASTETETVRKVPQSDVPGSAERVINPPQYIDPSSQ